MNPEAAHVTIMIVDDKPENLNLLGEMIGQEGWNVQSFPRGDLALAAAAAVSPDLVLLDVRMPGMDGYEVCRLFKADERLRQIPIIFMSAFSMAADKVRAFDAGGVDYITKPITESETLARIRTHLLLRHQQLHIEEIVRQRVTELAEANRHLRLLDEAKAQWISTLSHEIRTPLTGVFGISEILFMELPSDSKLHDLHKDYNVSRARIEKLMDDAFTLAAISISPAPLAADEVSLRHVLDTALTSVAMHVPDVHVRATISATDDVIVFGERVMLCRAFTDLIMTATRCVRPGEFVTLESRVSPEHVTVAIATGGKSLPPQALETFFDVGGQSALLKDGGDFGLGSTLASRIIRLFDGCITVRNGAEQGLLMNISLPARLRSVVADGVAR